MGDEFRGTVNDHHRRSLEIAHMSTGEAERLGRIQDLVRTLRDAERELHTLTGGELDSVAGEGGVPFLFVEAQQRLLRTEAAQRQLAEQHFAILNALAAHIALVDAEGVILALYAANAGAIAAVLTDMSMPIMDGPATIVALKALDPSVRIIGSSGLDADGTAAKARTLGVTDWVPKPYTADVLLRMLRAVIG